MTKLLSLSLHFSPSPCTPLEETIHWALGAGLAMLPAHSVFASNLRKSQTPELGTHSPRPLLFCSFLSFFCLLRFTPNYSPNPKSFQSDTMWAQIKPLSSGPCWHLSQITHLPPPALQRSHPPHPPPPPFLFVDNFLNAAKLPLSVHGPCKTAAKSQQLCKSSLANRG